MSFVVAFSTDKFLPLSKFEMVDNTLSFNNAKVDKKSVAIQLGVTGFIKRYLEEVSKFGYYEAPLEKTARKLELKFEKRLAPCNVELEVKLSLAPIP